MVGTGTPAPGRLVARRLLALPLGWRVDARRRLGGVPGGLGERGPASCVDDGVSVGVGVAPVGGVPPWRPPGRISRRGGGGFH